jgi:protein involved in polysaccharide export with SLBB domain
MVRIHRVTLTVLAAMFVTAVVVVAGTRLLQAEPPAKPAVPPPAASADSKPSANSRGSKAPSHRYSRVATLDFSGPGEVGAEHSILWPTGYTVVPLSNDKASQTKVAVSFAYKQGTPTPEEYRVVAMDKQDKLHEPTSQSSAMGGGAEVCTITIVSEFSLPRKDIVKLIVQQSSESVPQPAAGKPQTDRAATTVGAAQPSQEPYHIQPYDVLQIRVMGTLIDQPIDGFYLVELDGQVLLGPAYGRASLNGLTLEEAEKKITQQLQKVLTKPEVQVTMARRGITQWRRVVFPRVPYTIRPGDALCVRVMGTIVDQPIDGYYLVEPMGTVPLGPAYGRTQVNGLTLEGAEKAIREKLKDVLSSPDVQVTLPPPGTEASSRRRGAPYWQEAPIPKAPCAIKTGDLLLINVMGTIVGQPIVGFYLVEPTGTVPLGPAYGRVKVEGLTLEAAEKAIQKKLQDVLTQPDVSVTLAGWKDAEKMLILPVRPESLKVRPRREAPAPPDSAPPSQE